jgi:hypothetical protein
MGIIASPVALENFITHLRLLGQNHLHGFVNLFSYLDKIRVRVFSSN